MQEPFLLRESLEDVLKNIKRPGSFYVEGRRRTPMPLLEVAGIGPVAFPLIDLQAEQLRARCEPAPYGRGDQTLVDASVRRTWQLSTAQFKLEDPDFAAVLNGIVEQVRNGLGVEGAVRAEPYKLLLYDQGSFFLPHRDTEKAPGMFGTLVVALPSCSAGGELRVRHGRLEATLSLSTTHPGELRFAAFYADCEHEVCPVSSGYRIVLVYNLILERGTPPKAPDFEAEELQVRHLLERWDRLEEKPEKLLCVLEHRYSSSGLSWAGLKGADAGVASVMSRAASQAGCFIALAMISIEEFGSATYLGSYRRGHRSDSDDAEDYSIEEVHERIERVAEWRDVYDQPMALGPLGFEEDELYPIGILEDAPPDEQSFSEATGNEGASFEQTYRFAALVVWPERRLLNILSSAEPDVVLPKLEAWAAETARPQDRESARALCASLLNRWEAEQSGPDWGWGRHSKKECRLLLAAVSLGDPDLIRRGLLLVLRGRRTLASASEAVARAVFALGWEAGGALLLQEWTAQLQSEFRSCVAIFSQLGTLWGGSTSSGRSMLQRIGEVLVQVLPVHTPGTSSREPGLDPVILRALHSTLKQVGLGSSLEVLGQKLSAPGAYPVDELLLPTLLELPPALVNDATLAPMLSLVLEHLNARVGLPLEPPPDHRRDADVSCACENCKALKDFLLSPTRDVWDLKANTKDRSHVEGEIRQHNLDVKSTTIERGRPYILRCQKTMASYLRRCEQRVQDLKALATLEQGATAS